MSLLVERVTGVASVQDAGRPGHAHEGVPAGGAADGLSLRLANLAVGNAPAAAGVELAAGRLQVRALARCVVAASAGAGAYRPVVLEEGQALAVAPGPGCLRAYLAVAGGVDVPVVLGSRSTLVLAGLGGLDGRPLRAGDVLAVGRADARPERSGRMIPHWVQAMAAQAIGRRVLRIVLDAADGPPPAGLLQVTPRSDRVGLRLAVPVGQASGHADEPSDRPSRAAVYGTVQRPAAGELVLLGPDGPTTGGYPTVGTVAAVDLPAVGQLVPGQWLALRTIEREQAVALLAERERVLVGLERWLAGTDGAPWGR